MKKKNIKDDILRALVASEIPALSPDELFAQLEYDKSKIDFAILELEKAKHIAIVLPRTKNDTLLYTLTQDGEIFIRNTNYYEQHNKGKTNNYFKIADKAIALLGILTGIIFGVNSCSAENKNDQLIKLVKEKDSIINIQGRDFIKFENNIDTINLEIKELKKQIIEIKTTTSQKNSNK